jgi:hypothetical protein
VRPPNHREKMGDGGDIVISVPEDDDTTSGVVHVEDCPSPFAFDVAFPMSCSQLDVFEAIGIDIVQCAYHGYNGENDKSSFFCRVEIVLHRTFYFPLTLLSSSLSFIIYLLLS